MDGDFDLEGIELLQFGGSLLVDQEAVRVDADREFTLPGLLADGPEIGPHHRLPAGQCQIQEAEIGNLVDSLQDLVGRQLLLPRWGVVAEIAQVIALERDLPLGVHRTGLVEVPCYQLSIGIAHASAPFEKRSSRNSCT